MPTHAAFLRAVNLGATRKASKEQLTEAFEGLGFEDVATFRTSGNVVFTGKGAAGKLRSEIEKALKKALGFEVPVFLRTEAQLAAIAARKPFPPKALKASKGKLQVALLETKPPTAAVKRVEEPRERRGPPRRRRHRALLAPLRRHPAVPARHEGDRQDGRPEHDAHHGHDRADPLEVLRVAAFVPKMGLLGPMPIG